MCNEITKEQARSIEERYYKNSNNSSYTIKEYMISFIKSNFNFTSIKEFIIRINELVITEKLLRFKNELQSRISNETSNLVYFDVKDFITDKRLELLYEMRDKGILECMDKYPHWRIKDVIMNTKWKYVNKVFSPSNPIIDQFNKEQHKNIKAASEASGISKEDIKSNFGYKKRWIYVSSYTQFFNELPIEIINKFGSSRVFKNIRIASKIRNTSEKDIRYFINKGSYFEVHGMQQTFRCISFYEQFIRLLPVIIEDKDGNENKYKNLRNASENINLNICELKSYIDSGETFRHQSANTSYTARFAYDINVPEDKQMSFEKLVNEVYSKIKEIRDRYSLKYLFRITSPAA